MSSGWRQRHVAMTPMFVETQVGGSGSQVVGMRDDEDEGEEDMDTTDGGGSLATGEIRATQDVQFSATQGK